MTTNANSVVRDHVKIINNVICNPDTKKLTATSVLQVQPCSFLVNHTNNAAPVKQIDLSVDSFLI